MTAFWIALFVVFIAELGDKTQLVALAFATRYKASTVLLGVLLATLLVHLLSVALGEAVGRALPLFWVKLLAGLSFIGFGLWTLRGDTLDDEGKPARAHFGPLLTVATAFFVAELGDKTMLATVTVAGERRSFFPVWLGSTVGMVAADGLAVLVGKGLSGRLSDKPVRYGAAAIFILSGLYTLWGAATV
jgi:putative Ca2+/H+ antiporter (TMEM165/GDT1 family)